MANVNDSDKKTGKKTTYTGKKSTYIELKDDPADSRTVASKRRIRDQLESDIERYLKQGGQIKEVDTHVSGETIEKPSFGYGQRSI